MQSFKIEILLNLLHLYPKTANSPGVNPLTLQMKKQVINPRPELGL